MEKETPQQYTRHLLGYLGGKDSLRVMVETPRQLALLVHEVQSALKRCGGNVSEAARALGLSRSALYRRLQHHGL